MEQKTSEELQRIKDAVLAELKNLMGDKASLLISPRLMLDWDFYDYTVSRLNGHSHASTVFTVKESMPAADPYWGIAYSVLGLEARAEREFGQSVADALRKSLDEMTDKYVRAYADLRAERERAQPLLDLAKSYIDQCEALLESNEDAEENEAMGIVIEDAKAKIDLYGKGVPMDEQLKELVLARAAEIGGGQKYTDVAFNGGFVESRNYNIYCLYGENYKMYIGSDYPASDPVWPLAATVLKVQLPALD
jgi:hypothetical protein